MKIPVAWLKEYIDVPPKTADLADLLTMSGTKIEGIDAKKGTDVLRAEITTNRPDCLSLLGIAQEIAAVTAKRLKPRPMAELRPSSKNRLPLQIEVRDKKACPRYLGRVFDAVAVRPSPAWLVRNLEWMDQKCVNNVVDITNFCLYETGQPLHAFDYDKIKGAKIVVRRAEKGEKITALNGVEYALDERILVIADSRRPIAIAGVMGGKDTEVTAETKRVVLESAQFDPVLIRRATRFLKLQSESSYRFERTVDERRVHDASLRAAHLCVKLAAAVPASPLVEARAALPAKSEILRLRPHRMSSLLGAPIHREKAARILSSLGFKVKGVKKQEIKVKTLIQRADVRTEIDLIEEVARIYGFNKFPEKVPYGRDTAALPSNSEYRVIRRLKEFLAAQGLSEAVTFSLLSERAAKAAGADALVRVTNPLSQEQEVLSPSGLAGLLSSIAHNVNRKESDVAFFETAKRFRAGREVHCLSMAVTGQAAQSWQEKRPASFHYLKGLVENVFRHLGRPVPEWKEEPAGQAFSQSLLLEAAGARVGHCAVVSPQSAQYWDLKQPVFFAEIDLDAALALLPAPKRFSELSKTLPVRRDIAFIVSAAISAADIENAVKKEIGAALASIALFDVFTGAHVPAGKRSLAFALEYRKAGGTFTDDEIRSLHERAAQVLKEKFGAELR